MVNTFHCPIFVWFRTEYINLLYNTFYIRLKKEKINMACITAEVDANLNQCMVNTLLTNLGKKNTLKNQS